MIKKHCRKKTFILSTITPMITKNCKKKTFIIFFTKKNVHHRWVMPNYFYTTVREIPGTGHSVQLVFIDTVLLVLKYGISGP